ncbi:uncharacterized protein LOC120795256 isoform X6 [Xiphias gladius]|uniref:uncharacterized protein LOC120795256 isoform X6 n=1 Tax=Xiphias gladius TaxID=8245 RepID=UPI001A99BAF6|nr:uncharacterized protein LOC120795256 isoform X6 [Xiphias gladius]
MCLPAGGKQMDSAAVCGKNMKNANEPRGLKRVKCPDRREDTMCGSLRKQCIESEKLFHFLRDLAERATSTAALKDSRGMRPDVMKYPLKKRLTWVKWRREGASTHLTTTQAPASRSSTSAYDCECTARGNCCDHSSRFILSFFFFFFKSFFILAFLFLGTMLGKKTVIFTFTR